MQLRDFAFGQGDDAGTGKGRLFIEAGNMLLVTGDAVQALGQHDIDGPGPDGQEQLLIIRAVQACSRYCMISEYLVNAPALPFSADLADTNLILD